MRTWTAGGGGGRWGGGGGWETEKKSRGNKILKSVRVTCVGAEIEASPGVCRRNKRWKSNKTGGETTDEQRRRCEEGGGELS